MAQAKRPDLDAAADAAAHGIQVRKPQTDPDSPEYDPAAALETLRKIRRGSKKGGMMSKMAFEVARQQLGPDWKEKIDKQIKEEEEREERGEGEPAPQH